MLIRYFLCLSYKEECSVFEDTIRNAWEGITDIINCNRIIEGSDKTCRQAVPLAIFKAKQEGPAQKMFNRAYKTHYSKVSTGYMSKEMFKLWSKEAREKREKCLSGEITLEEFDKRLSD